MNELPNYYPDVLREYALLADGQRGALVGPQGEIVWMCVPRWDSDAVFSTLIGGKGVYAVTPSDPWRVWGGYYERGSLIWHSRWMTSTGPIECREALSFPGEQNRVVVLRQVQALGTPADLRVVLDPHAGFGRQAMRRLRQDGSIWSARVGPLHLRWSGAAEATDVDNGLVLDLQLPAGATHDLVLELSDRPLPDRPVDPAAAWTATEHGWEQATPRLEPVVGQRDCLHAYAVLRGMTGVTGGVVAAATTALPERAHAGRNYDYRYTWIRDQCYVGQAVAVAGGYELLDGAVEFIAQRILDDGHDLRPVYTVDGASLPEERELPGVAGYPGGGNVVGNQAGRQFQLDIFGEALLLFAAASRQGRIGSDHWRAVETATKVIEQHRDEAGAGVWEIHEDHWAHSRLICAAGLRSIAAAGATRSQAASWTAMADSIVADTARECLHSSGRWQRAPDDERVDASLVMPAVRGALPGTDPRSRATLDAVRTELTHDGYVYRYRHDQRPLHEAEGAFLLCGFMAAMATQQQGNEIEARAWFERNRAACGRSGLYAEEYDVKQRQLRGNLPQAFVHALMLEVAHHLRREIDE